ncbi:Not1 N-terminal domain, CCR4-Not complex component-domain-containing protein [Russula ochroleuca]|uniref:General negative regulator of transcription subunit n=1 Tax=Russula ochroleuca TaxID=152965 RepID=A0A9P5N3J1_9AGAM|nr:Not1 N-terminal domain, CCR4-Not complex component-domain-containing protein [Russula ochroleuca]
MAARKLQTEIDRTLKKVAEGVELFESIYDKMQASTNQTQKEKLETDLKTQIKKLQRLRDQIKTWVASNDIKDKTALLENRRLIETQMEKFKACEKEMKTKAFSKEGLIQSAKLDPKAQEKLEQTQWLQTCVEELLLQVETAEAEIETLQQGGRKKGKVGATAQDRLEELERLNERRKWHISRLEIMLRLLDNGTLSTEQVQGLKDDVNYFVEDNSNDDYDEDEGIYDDLNLDEEEEKFGRLITEDHDSDGSDDASEDPTADLPSRTPSKKHDEESMASSKREESSPILKKAGAALQLRKHSTAGEAPKPPPNPNFAQQPMSSILKAGLPAVQPRPPLKYATAAAAAVTPSASQQSNASASSSSAPTQVTPPAPVPAPAPAPPPPKPEPVASTTLQDHIAAVTSSPSLTQISTSSPFLSSTSASAQQPDGSFGSPLLSEAESHPEPSVSASAPSPLGAGVHEQPQEVPAPSAAPPSADGQASSAWHAPAPVVTSIGSTSTSVPETARSPAPLQAQQQQQAPGSSPLPPAAQTQPQQPQFPPGVKLETQRPPSVLQQQPQQPQQQQQQQTTQRNGLPSLLSDLVVPFENVKQKAAHRMANLDQVHKLLDGGYSNMPQPQDTEKPKYYVPRNPYQAPSYYPQTTNSILSSPRLFAQLDVETLFYVFYFLPGTYQQFLAAKELKRQSWRFHVKYLTWFQRHSEPQAITEEYEQGVYVYFDWEGSWCQRKKSDFRFEYRYLSED